jgi:16S rRNA (guanine1207-N2)-methyltransferase
MQYRFEEIISDIPLLFETNDCCFSPKKADQGTLAMLSKCEPKSGQKILDLGCGYGVAGIYCAQFTEPGKIFMSDIDADVLLLARRNALLNNAADVQIIKSDGFADIDEKDFDLILCNPPYHTDFSVAKHFIEKGFRHLKFNGRMLMVTKRLEWYKRKFIAVFGGVRIHRIGGYFVFEAEKRG